MLGLADTVGSSLESHDASLQLCQRVSDLVVGPGQGRDRVLHLPHCQGQLLRRLEAAVGQTSLHTETPPVGGGGDLGSRHRPGGGVRHAAQ